MDEARRVLAVVGGVGDFAMPESDREAMFLPKRAVRRFEPFLRAGIASGFKHTQGTGFAGVARQVGVAAGV
jgi:hypothetical protein